MPTSPVVATVSGASFTVPVAAANLDTVLTLRDFVVLENGTLTLNPLSYTKVTPTSINYSGPSLAGGTSLEIRRNTPRDQRTLVLPNTKVRASDWNAEFDRRVRIQEEVDLYGAGGGFTVRLPVDAPYGVAWSTDTLFSPTRKALYDKMETFIGTNSPTFTGTPTAPTQATADNSTRLATTAYVKNNLIPLAPIASPVFTGVPTAPTAIVSDNSTTLATTAHVKLNLASYALTSSLATYAPLASPALTGTPTAPTALTSDNSTTLATTAHVKANIAPLAPLASPALTGVPTAPTLAVGTNTTQLVNGSALMQRGKPFLIASRITSPQALPITVDTPLIWNNEIRDVDNMLDPATGIITLPRVGYYRVTCNVLYSGTSSLASLSVIEGGTLTRIVRLDFRGPTSGAIVLSGSALVYVSAANTQIRLAVGDLSVAGNMANEANSTVRISSHVSVMYEGID